MALMMDNAAIRALHKWQILESCNAYLLVC
jgi:hypothetical protein